MKNLQKETAGTRGNQFIWYLLLFPLLLCSSCARYIAYKTSTADSYVAYETMAAHWSPQKEYILSTKGSEYRLKDVTFDTVSLKGAVVPPKDAATWYYHPEVSQDSGSKKAVVKHYRKKLDSSALMNQVFLVSDDAGFSGDFVAVPMASIKRIDVVKESYGLAVLLVVLGLIVGAIVYAFATIDIKISPYPH